MNEKRINEIAFGAGAAFGVFVGILFRLGLLWVYLWVLNYLGWLPF